MNATQSNTKRDRPFVQITPPHPGGVADYAARLQSEWSRSRNVETIHVSGPGSLSSGRIARNADVILHMSGYGYASRGLCGWLADDIARLKLQRPDVRVTVIFHELYAFGPPWRSAFWTSISQRRIVKRLAGLADRLVTNSDLHQARLARVTSSPVLMRPVFSNVGEPAERSGWADRTRRIVLFGSEPTRARAAQQAKSFLASTDLDVVEIGSGDRAFAGGRWLGALPAAELSGVLSRSMFGLFGQDSALAKKSSVFAAYASHGCIPVLHGQTQNASGMNENGWFTTTTQVQNRDEDVDFDRMSSAIFAWYQDHAIRRQASDILDYVDSGVSDSLRSSQPLSRDLSR